MEGSGDERSQAASAANRINRPEIAAGSAYPRIPLPTMEDGEIENYFMSLEFWFAASGVADDGRKYNTVMAQVPARKLTELRPIIDAVPERNRYEYIKRSLVEHFADSRQRRLQRVLAEMPLGDNKPSKLYYDMARTAGGSLSEQVLLDLWATRLPRHAQAAAAASCGTLAVRLQIADAVTESLSMRTDQIDAVRQQQQWPGMDSIRDEVSDMIRELVNRSRSPNQKTSRAGSSRHRSSDSSGRRNSPNQSDHCWYHRRFGSKAQACRSPCGYRKPAASK